MFERGATGLVRGLIGLYSLCSAHEESNTLHISVNGAASV